MKLSKVSAIVTALFITSFAIGCGVSADEAGTSSASDTGTVPTADSGCGCTSDSGSPVADSGTPVTDTGSPSSDSGTPATDTGSGVDSTPASSCYNVSLYFSAKYFDRAFVLGQPVVEGDLRSDAEAKFYTGSDWKEWSEPLGCRSLTSTSVSCTVCVPEGYDLRWQDTFERSGTVMWGCTPSSMSGGDPSVTMDTKIGGVSVIEDRVVNNGGFGRNCQVGKKSAKK